MDKFDPFNTKNEQLQPNDFDSEKESNKQKETPDPNELKNLKQSEIFKRIHELASGNLSEMEDYVKDILNDTNELEEQNSEDLGELKFDLMQIRDALSSEKSAEASLSEGKYKRAIMSYERALTRSESPDLKEKLSDANRLWADELVKGGELESSQEYYEEAIKFDSSNEKALKGLERVYKKMGDDEKAEEYYQTRLNVYREEINKKQPIKTSSGEKHQSEDEIEKRVHVRAGDEVEKEAFNMEKNKGNDEESEKLLRETLQEYKKSGSSDRLIGLGMSMQDKALQLEDKDKAKQYLNIALEAFDADTDKRNREAKLNELSEVASTNGFDDIAEEASQKAN